MSTCSTDSLLPAWVTLGFITCSIIILIATSTYSMKIVRQSSLQGSLSSRLQNQSGHDLESHSTVPRPNNKDKPFNCLDWIRDVKDRRSVYLPLISHISDTATDFASIIEFYQIAIVTTPSDCNGLNIWYLFVGSIACMIIYRTLSSVTIYSITHSLRRVLLQWIDIELFEILYISHRINLKSKSAPQRLISVMEAVFEAAPQSILQMIFLTKTGAMSSQVILISSILSFVNLTMTVIGDDKKFLEVKFAVPWKDNDYDNTLKFMKKKGKIKFWKYIFLHLFRFSDVPSQILLYIFVWYFVGIYGMMVMAIDFVIALSIYIKTKCTDALLTVVALPFSLGDYPIIVLRSFWMYAILRSIALLVWIWINAMDSLNDETPFVTALLWYCSVGCIMRWFFGGWMYWKLGVSYFDDETKERSNIDGLLSGYYYDDAIELIFYKNLDIIANVEAKTYGKGKYKYSLLAIASGTANDTLFEEIYQLGLDDYNDQGNYFTALMVAAKDGHSDCKIEYIKAVLDHHEINMDYIMKKDQKYGWTALYHVIKVTRQKHGDELMAAFLESVGRIIEKQNDSNAIIIEFLDNGQPEKKRTALHVACKERAPLSIFISLYQFYPEDHRNNALNQRDIEGKGILDYCSDQNNIDYIKQFVESQISTA